MGDRNYSVELQQRINAIFGGDFVLTDDDTFTYTWRQGYEILTVKHEQGGSFEYRGSYHPDGSCEGNPCIHCGKAFYE